MAESFPFSMATNLLTKIASPGCKEICRSSGLQTGIRKLEETLSNLKADLLVAEEHKAHHQNLRDWLAEISDLLYDAEDALDILECRALRRQVVNPAGSYKSNKLRRLKLRDWLGELSDLLCNAEDAWDKLDFEALRRQVVNPARSYESNKVRRFFQRFKKIPREIQNIERKLSKMAAKISKYLNERTLSRDYSRERVINHLFVGATQVFGRDYDKENIIELLMRPNDVQNENISVISIVGIEGLGKTTLAKMVYSDERIDEQFQLKMWASLPENFSTYELLKVCYTSATGKNYDGVLLAGKDPGGLEGTLSGKKFLLVLDHVTIGNGHEWNKLKDILLEGASGSKVLVTTPTEKVASMMGAVHSYPLNHLSHEDSVSLFMRSAFRDGEDIVRQCGGIPLVLKIIGTLLYRNTDGSHWLLTKANSIWMLEEKNKIRQVLKLSYAHLPSHLQRCLAFCALFPKNYHFNSNCLISYWMAVGYLVPREKNEELEDVGLQYLRELIWRCFFQNVEDHVYYLTFQMHDFVNDLTVEVAQRECKTVDLISVPDDINARHLSIRWIKMYDPDVPSNLRKLQTIIVQSLQFKCSWESLINKCISNFGYLRLLSLTDKGFENLPDSIGTLKHLRLLDLCWNFILKELSEAICELQSLQTLRLLGCSELQNLPKKMRNMISLRYLEITTKERHLPQYNGIEYLSSLRYLHLCDCHNLESLPDRMQSLTSLQTLILQGCHNLISLPRSIAYLVRLEKLVIHSCRNLNLKMDMHGKDGCLKLQVFMLYELAELVDLPQLILQGSANTLEHMRIEACPKLTALPAWIANLSSLEKLEIVSCPRLSSLPNGMQNLTALRKLKIKRSPALNISCTRNWANIYHVPKVHLESIFAP